METPPPASPIISLIGEKVALGPMLRENVPLFTKWMNDFKVTRTLAWGLRPVSLEAEIEWFESVAKENDLSLTIYEKETLRPIGNTRLGSIDHFHRTAEFGLMIGEKECWGKGYGTETTRLVLEYGFTALGLHNILLTVYSYNERGVRAYTRAGFREFGRRREAFRIGGRAYDIVYMDCLAPEFEGSVLKHLLPED